MKNTGGFLPWKTSRILSLRTAFKRSTTVPSDFEIVREDMDMGLTVSGGRVLLQLSPDEEWHCLSTEISEEDVENQGSIEEYFDSLWDFWLFGDGDCPWYELCPSDILLKILCAALPDRTLSVRECESVPHLGDTDGNEYFFGKMVSFDCEFSWEEDSNVHLTANEWKNSFSQSKMEQFMPIKSRSLQFKAAFSSSREILPTTATIETR